MAIVVSEQAYSEEEYLKMEEGSAVKYEFINGKIIEMPGGTGIHNIIVMNIATALKIALKKKNKKYLVMGSDMKIQIEAFRHFRYPDAVVVCEKLEYYGDRKDVIINPLLIVEVLSDGTEKFDRGLKFEEYKTLSSFQEYVLVVQQMPYVSTYHREAEDLWRIQTTQGLTQAITLKSVGCELQLADIYEHIEFENRAV